jgi:ABC-type transport system substrate-binding protein
MPKGRTPSELSDFLAKNIDDMAVYGDVRGKPADQSDVQWCHRPSLSLFFCDMNCSHPHLPHLKHPAFRKALSAAIDRTAFLTQGYNGQFDIAMTILPPGMPRETSLFLGRTVRLPSAPKGWRHR